MKSNLENHFNEVKKVLEILPTNTKANRKKKKDYLLDELKVNNENIEIVYNEIKKRLTPFDKLKENLEISELINKLNEYTSKINISNYNTSYEKMHLDYYLYKLKTSSKKDLKAVNEYLHKIIDAFNTYGITLEENDFFYNNHVKNYMYLILNNKPYEELKNKFEEIYWKFPNLLDIIIINIKSIYNKYNKVLDKHFNELLNKKIEEIKDTNINKKIIELNKEIKRKKHTDPFIIYNNFISGKWKITDYSQNIIDSKIKKYFTKDSYNYDNLINLSRILFEYYLIKKYNYLLNDMKERIEKKAEYKNALPKILKDIKKLENKIIKLNKHNKKGLFSKKSDEKYLFNYNNCIEELRNKYEELDNQRFNNLIATKLQTDSSILEVLKFISAHYIYFVNLSIDNAKDIDSIDKEFEELKDEVCIKEYNMINSIALLDRKQMKEIIANKYRLEGIMMNPDYLEETVLEETMMDINNIMRYEDILSSGLSIDDIELCIELNKIK